MKPFFRISVFCLLIANDIFTQNLLINSGFESGNSGKPDSRNQMEESSAWQSFKDHCCVDWISVQPSMLNAYYYQNLNFLDPSEIDDSPDNIVTNFLLIGPPFCFGRIIYKNNPYFPFNSTATFTYIAGGVPTTVTYQGQQCIVLK